MYSDLVPFPCACVETSLIPRAFCGGFGMQIFCECFHVCACAVFRHKFMPPIFYYTQIIFWLPHYSPAYHPTILPLKLRTLIRAPSDVLKPLLLSLLLFNGVYFQFYCFACFRLCRRRRLFIFTRLVSSISSFLTLWPRLILSVWLLAQIKYILTYTLTYMPVHYLSVLPQIAKKNCSHHKKHQQTHTMLSLGGFVL